MQWHQSSVISAFVFRFACFGLWAWFLSGRSKTAKSGKPLKKRVFLVLLKLKKQQKMMCLSFCWNAKTHKKTMFLSFCWNAENTKKQCFCRFAETRKTHEIKSTNYAVNKHEYMPIQVSPVPLVTFAAFARPTGGIRLLVWLLSGTSNTSNPKVLKCKGQWFSASAESRENNFILKKHN